MHSHRDRTGDGRRRNTGCGLRSLRLAIGILHGMAIFALASALLFASARMAEAQTYSVLYSFNERGDGAEPLGPVTYSAELEHGGERLPDGLISGNLLAGYAHLHFASNPAIPVSLLSQLGRLQ